MQTHPDCMALYVFVFLRPGFCRQLPSDSTSRGYPCPKLMVATANSIADFHCQAITHARHTPLPPSKKVVF